jgi:hypothetical protein
MKEKLGRRYYVISYSEEAFEKQKKLLEKGSYNKYAIIELKEENQKNKFFPKEREGRIIIDNGEKSLKIIYKDKLELSK